MEINDQLKGLETEYYQIKSRVFFDSDSNYWMGKVRVYRKDTGEEIDAGFRVVDKDQTLVKEKMLSKINSSFKKEMSELDVPMEWKSPARPILVRCIKLGSFISGFGGLCKEVLAGAKNIEEYDDQYIDFWQKLVEETIEISRSIEALTPHERIQLLTSPENVFENPEDFWNLDDITYRSRIFKFFLNPSQDEIDAHQNQLSRMEHKFHELGWDEQE
ncbi:MAG: hypothetical protein ACU84J_16375 [Gammaproteobacteria bacterium]